MYFEWTLWKLIPNGKERVDSDSFTATSLTGGKIKATRNFIPDDLKHWNWIHNFANVYSKNNGVHEFFLRAIPSHPDDLPRQMGG